MLFLAWNPLHRILFWLLLFQVLKTQWKSTEYLKLRKKTPKWIVTVSQITSSSWAEVMINKGFLDVEKFIFIFDFESNLIELNWCRDVSVQWYLEFNKKQEREMLGKKMSYRKVCSQHNFNSVLFCLILKSHKS